MLRESLARKGGAASANDWRPPNMTLHEHPPYVVLIFPAFIRVFSRAGDDLVSVGTFHD